MKKAQSKTKKTVQFKSNNELKSNTQLKSNNEIIFDPRVSKNNYSAAHMALLVSYIIVDVKCRFELLTHPQNQAENAKTMITDICNEPEDTVIVMILEYSATNYGVLIIECNVKEVYYNETHGTQNQLYTDIFLPYFSGENFTIESFTTNYHTTYYNVGVYAIYIVKQFFSGNTAPSLTTEDEIRDDHYNILVNNNFYNTDYYQILKVRLDLVSFPYTIPKRKSYGKIQQHQQQNDGYDPRVNENYGNTLMKIIISFFF